MFSTSSGLSDGDLGICELSVGLQVKLQGTRGMLRGRCCGDGERRYGFRGRRGDCCAQGSSGDPGAPPAAARSVSRPGEAVERHAFGLSPRTTHSPAFVRDRDLLFAVSALSPRALGPSSRIPAVLVCICRASISPHAAE